MTTLDAEARNMIERVIPHLEPNARDFGNYEYWVTDWNTDPEFRSAVARAARLLLSETKTGLIRSAMQALAVVGERTDIELFSSLKSHHEPAVRNDVDACIQHIEFRMKSLDELLNDVADWKSFATFVSRLAAEREQAQAIENANSDSSAHKLNGALGWNNGDIQSFLWASLSFFPYDMTDDHPHAQPTWRNFAEMLYHGKIIE